MSDDFETRNQHLEPRVAKLEGQLDRLTEDVRSLASIVRDQGSNVEKQLSELTVAVTQAAGPKKTDWGTLISAVLLIMAIGSAAFWPLNQTVQENKVSIDSLNEKFIDHSKLSLHPVGQALVQKLELQLKDHVDDNRREFEKYRLDSRDMRSILTESFQKDMLNFNKMYSLEINSLKEKIDLHNERLYGRVVKLEDRNLMEIEREKDELQMWRLKAMGISNTPVINTHTHEVVEQEQKKD